jgi:hypothetical protein
MRARTILIPASAPAAGAPLGRPAVGRLTPDVQAQDEPPAGGVSFTSERGFPTKDVAKRARDDAHYRRALTAYRAWYPTVSIEGPYHGRRENGIPGRRSASAKRS